MHADPIGTIPPRSGIRGALLVTNDPHLGTFRGDIELEGTRILRLVPDSEPEHRPCHPHELPSRPGCGPECGPECGAGRGPARGPADGLGSRPQPTETPAANPSQSPPPDQADSPRRHGAESAAWEDGSGWVILPGFVQGHLHLCQTLLRGLANGLPLHRWLAERIWPLEAAHDHATMAASARLGIAEALLSGVTTILDMGSVHHTAAIAESADAMGIRAILGKALMDHDSGAPTALTEASEDALREALDLHRRWHGQGGGRLSVALAPRFTLSVSAGLWRELALEAARNDLLIHTHLSETDWENETCMALHGDRPLACLARWGVLANRTALVHGVRLETDEIDMLAAHPAAVVHCPGSNAKLGSGIADVCALLRAGIPVALGSDGAACDDSLALALEMRLSAQLQNLLHGPGRFTAREAFRLATSGGAAVLGLDEQIGSLTPGRQADWIAYREEDLGWGYRPGQDIAEALVWNTPLVRPVEVCVAGRRVVHEGRLRVGEWARIQIDADRARQQLRERSGV